jgi:hypothetical protein
VPADRSAVRHSTVYRGLLALYPRSFRAGYGEPMAQLFADRFRDVGAKAWLRAIPDLILTVPVQRTEAAMSRLSTGARVIAIALIVLGATVVSIGIGGGALPVMLVALIALVVSQRQLFALIPGRDHAPLVRAVTQTWWAPVAAGLGLLTLLAGVGNIFSAHNTSGRLVGSTLLIAFGVGMFYGLVRRPFARPAGNAMILLTTIPAGLVFWLIVPTVLALVVWIGVISSGFGDRPVGAAAS